MASSAFSLTDDLPHEDKILDASEPTDDAETREDDLEETAPNWAFASFVTERDELLGIFANLKPIEHSQRITTIVRYLYQLSISRLKSRHEENLNILLNLPNTLCSVAKTDPTVSRTATATRSPPGAHDNDSVRVCTQVFSEESFFRR